MTKKYLAIPRGDSLLVNSDGESQVVEMADTVQDELKNAIKDYGAGKEIELYEVTFTKILTGWTPND